MRRLAAVGLVAAALLLAGCSGGDDGTDAAAAAAETPSAAPSAAPSGGAADFEAYQQCLSDNGVDVSALGQGGFGGGQRPSGMPTDRPTDFPSGMPTDLPSDFPTDGAGRGPGGGAGMNAPEGVDEETWQAAQQACADLRPSFGGGMGGPGGQGQGAATYQVFWSCMADHDVQPPESGLPADLDTADATVADALETCQKLLPAGTSVGA